MFTHPVRSKSEFRVVYNDFAKRHFLKNFEKKYKGKLWKLTETGYLSDLARLGLVESPTQFSQQIDELWREGNKWIFKYDFRIFGSKVSSKAAGNRIVGVLDADKGEIEIFLIYNKTDLPKNTAETEYIKGVYGEIYS